MSESDAAFIGVNPCGCVVAAVVARPEYADSWGPDIARWAKEGMEVRLTTVGKARAMDKFLVNCKCETQPQKEALFS